MKRNTIGFTIVELLVVLAVLIIIAAFIMSGFKNYARSAQYDTDATLLKTTLIDARVKARSAELDQAYGVKFFENSVVVFYGTTYSAGAATNQTVTFEALSIDHTLTAGTDEIIFNKLTGLPNATGTVIAVGTEHVATTTLTIGAAGVIQ